MVLDEPHSYRQLISRTLAEAEVRSRSRGEIFVARVRHTYEIATAGRTANDYSASNRESSKQYGAIASWLQSLDSRSHEAQRSNASVVATAKCLENIHAVLLGRDVVAEAGATLAIELQRVRDLARGLGLPRQSDDATSNCRECQTWIESIIRMGQDDLKVNTANPLMEALVRDVQRLDNRLRQYRTISNGARILEKTLETELVNMLSGSPSNQPSALAVAIGRDLDVVVQLADIGDVATIASLRRRLAQARAQR